MGDYLSVSVKQFLWHVTAVIGDLPQDGAVQPHVHLCRTVLKSRRRAQLIGEFSSSSSTAIDVEQLEQVDDRGPPVTGDRIGVRGVIRLFESADYGISGVSVGSTLLSSDLAGEPP